MKPKELLELTLIKTVNYKLKPFGRFLFDWNNGKRAKRINVMYIGEIDTLHDTTMPLTDEQDKMVVKLMLKHKTDVYIDDRFGNRYYTRISGGWTEIGHKKLFNYKAYLLNNKLEDSDDTWKNYIENNI